MAVSRAPAGRQAVLVLAGAIAAGSVVRLLVFQGPGFPSDVGTFMAWADRMASVGPARFYEPGYFSDYPPAFLYVLWLVGSLFDGEALRLVVKMLSLPADIAIAVLLYRVVRGQAGAYYGAEGEVAGRSGTKGLTTYAGALAGALWMLQPGAIFAGPFWGQVDAWGTLPFLGALVAAGQRRWAVAGALSGLAGMVKPQFGLVAIVVGVAAAIEAFRTRRWGTLAVTAASGLVTVAIVALPFGVTPGAFIDLVRTASETYPYTSLYAFNVWSIVGDFWEPDTAYVAIGGIALVAGIVASLVPLWWRRDTAMLLAAGAFAGMAFYFLPTRAHERYLFPVFALLAPFAIVRARISIPYAVLAGGFFVTLYFAFTRYPQNGLAAAPLIEATLFSRTGQIAIAMGMIGSAALLAWRLVRGEARLDPSLELAEPVAARPWQLPAGLGLGRAPTRRDVTLALAVALAVIATRGFRLDQPRDMYFDEVYHARTAMELLAQNEPYEWTHPHLAKEIMAVSILAFGGDRVEAREAAPAGITAFAVSNDGVRAYGFADGTVRVCCGPEERLDGPVRALAFDGGDWIAATDRSLYLHGIPTPLEGSLTSLAYSRGRAIVGTATGVEIRSLAAGDHAIRLAIPTVALTAKPDSDDVFVADPDGVIHVINAATGLESARLTGGARPTALAYARGPDRLYAARAGEAAIDWYEPPSGDRQSGSYGGKVDLANARTGIFQAPVTALAVVPRTQFLYAIADGRLVVTETYGNSPYAAIPVGGTAIGIDGVHDQLLVAGATAIETVPTGRHALAWRIPGVLFAAVLAFFVVLIARRLFASPLVAAFAGAAVVLDGSMFAQARIGMNDIYVAAFLVAGWYFVIAAHRPRRSAAADLVIAGLLFGLALASKWVAAYALGGLGLLSVAVTAWAWSQGRPGTGGPLDLLARRGVNAVVLFCSFFLIPLVVYVGSYAQWFGGPTIPMKWSLWELTQQMYWYHSGLTSPHPAGSPWWSWPFVLKPVYWYLGSPGNGQTAVIYDAGNIVLFWAAVAAFVWAFAAAIRARSLSLGLLVFAMLTQYVAWVPITRVLFFYHFFTALPFFLLILAAALAALWETGHRVLVTAFFALATAAFVFFYPFVSGQPVAADQAAAFFVLPTWQYDCQFYPSFRCESAFRGDIPVPAILGRVAIGAGVALLAYAAFSLRLTSGAIAAIVRAARTPRP
ncbi:MAG: phospholipid carrier-dependent glycosyltransferase [Chloroflexi bacterium]|nr:phospholipid carrier-dependent glycosyltransferase [Chloroflexota bacterium]